MTRLDYNCTDLGNARRLIDAFGGDLRRSVIHSGAGKDGWLVWDGKRWQEDRTLAVFRYAAEVPDLIREDADAIRVRKPEPAEEEPGGGAGAEAGASAGGGAGGGKKERGAKAKAKGRPGAKAPEAAPDPEAARQKALRAWAHKSESATAQRAMVMLARSDPRIVVDEGGLDKNGWLFNCANGTLDLRTGKLKPHDRTDLITRLAPTEYDPDAPCPMWEEFLNRIMCGRPEIVEYLQRLIGYSLVGTISEQVFVICYGEGSNGKGTFLNTVKACIGDYAASTNSRTFQEKGNDAIPNDLAALRGKRMVVASENKEGKVLDEEVVNSISGGDGEAISVRYMRGEWFDFVPEFTAWLMVNNQPIVKTTNNGFWRRVKMIPFDYNFEKDPDKDPDFGKKLLAAEAPGILAWAVRGCMEWQRVGLAAPVAVLDTTQEYRAEMDVVADFLDDRCDAGPGFRCDNSALYAAYKLWAVENGMHVNSQRWLTRRLKKRGLVLLQGDRKVWEGMRLVPTDGDRGWAQDRWG